MISEQLSAYAGSLPGPEKMTELKERKYGVFAYINIIQECYEKCNSNARRNRN